MTFWKHFQGKLSGSTTKKVCIERFEQDVLEGYVHPEEFLHDEGIEVLASSAQAIVIPYEQVQAVYFVRDFGEDLNSGQRQQFLTRPKLSGVWVRMSLVNGKVIEGVIPNDMRLVCDHGLTFTPPDSRGNAQQVFVPKKSLMNFQVLGVIGSPLKVHRPKSPRKSRVDTHQMSFFPETT